MVLTSSVHLKGVSDFETRNRLGQAEEECQPDYASNGVDEQQATYRAKSSVFIGTVMPTVNQGIPKMLCTSGGQAAVLFARSTMACCCSDTRRRTVLYTFFFLVAEALFMKSANEELELVDGDFLVDFIISSNLVATQESFKG